MVDDKLEFTTCLLCNNTHVKNTRICPHCGAFHGLKTTAEDLNKQREILKQNIIELQQLKRCHTCGSEVKHPMCDNCYANNIGNAQQFERGRVLDELMNESIKSRYQEAIHENAPENFMPAIVVQLSQLRIIVESLRGGSNIIGV